MDWIVYLFKPVFVFINNIVNNWAWSIIIFTLLIKFVLFPTSINQFRSMDKLKKVQPKLKEIQDKYKDKPEEFQRRTMELYKKEGVNPFGSCLPTIIQFFLLVPIYWLLQDPKFGIAPLMVNTSFLWFRLGDIHVPWTNIPLAILSGITTFIQQKLMTPVSGGAGAGSEQSQQMFLYLMPVMLAFFTYQVNAAMGLYWIISNLIGILQQYLINEYFIVKEHIHKDEGKA